MMKKRAFGIRKKIIMKINGKICFLFLFSLVFLLMISSSVSATLMCSATPGVRVGPADGESLNRLGTSVAVKGDTAFMGAPGRVNPDPILPSWTTTGAAYIARWNGSIWNLSAPIYPPDGANMDKFGQAVALHGTWGVVGAPGDDTSAGSAYVYQSNADGSVWSYRQKLLSPTRTSYEYFGQSVAISGSTMVVGAYGYGTYRGKAYIYHWDGSTWTWVQTLAAPSPATYDYFGYAVAVSGNTILVGAYGDDVIGTNSGSVYVYRYNGVTWVYSQTFWPSNVASGDSFGSSVALDSATAVIGAPVDDSFTGSAYVFRDNGSSFQWNGTLVASDRMAMNRFGQTVAVSGSGILIGALYWTNNARGIDEQGKAYYFTYDGTMWLEKLSLLQPSPWGYYKDHFGSAVALDGGTAVVGAPDEDPPAPQDAGKTYFFDITCANYHPADTDNSFRINISEATKYGSYWKNGQTWPTPPSPIPISYATSAGSIWKNGEAYHYDSGFACPQCWVVGP